MFSGCCSNDSAGDLPPKLLAQAVQARHDAEAEAVRIMEGMLHEQAVREAAGPPRWPRAGGLYSNPVARPSRRGASRELHAREPGLRPQGAAAQS